MIKNQIYAIMMIIDSQWILATNKSKSFSQFQEKCLKIIY